MILRLKSIAVLVAFVTGMGGSGWVLFGTVHGLNRGMIFALPQSDRGGPTRNGDTSLTIKPGLQSDDHRIVPGNRVGLLQIGDSQERAFQVFVPKAGTDQKYQDECGDGYDWVQMDDAGISRGTETIHFRHGTVTQIESASPAYTTSNGDREYDTPGRVRRHWAGLNAYALLPASSDATGGLPLIFWVNDQLGIAFKFAFSQERKQRYLYSIIVFPAGGHLCPEGQGELLSPQTWRPLPPYATRVAVHP